MSESIRKLNENPVTALADTDYIVACDSQGNLSPIKKADFTAGIQAGGRNLVKNSNSKGTTNTYHVATFYFGEDKPKQGEVITVTIWGDFSKIEYLSLWNSGGDISIGGALKINDNLLRAHVLWNTFNDSNPQDIINTVSLQIFKYPNNNTNVTIDRIMVERGSVAHDWTPAPEDILDRLTALENRGG